MTRTIEIPLPEDLLRRADEKAHSAGLKRDAYICAILSKDVTGEPSISEILTSFREHVTASGITCEELDHLFAEARKESYGERNPRKTDER